MADNVITRILKVEAGGGRRVSVGLIQRQKDGTIASFEKTGGSHKPRNVGGLCNLEKAEK